nr:MAG TPA: Bacterial lipoprotein [Caudoviricetes sp.]
MLNEKYNSIEGLVTLDPANKRVVIGNVVYPT